MKNNSAHSIVTSWVSVIVLLNSVSLHSSLTAIFILHGDFFFKIVKQSCLNLSRASVIFHRKHGFKTRFIVGDPFFYRENVQMCSISKEKGFFNSMDNYIKWSFFLASQVCHAKLFSLTHSRFFFSLLMSSEKKQQFCSSYIQSGNSTWAFTNIVLLRAVFFVVHFFCFH